MKSEEAVPGNWGKAQEELMSVPSEAELNCFIIIYAVFIYFADATELFFL